MVQADNKGLQPPVLPNYVSDQCAIANNSISKFGGHSITVMGDRIILSGNVVTEGGQNGIDCRASHSIVEGNIVHKCNMYGYNNAADFVQLRNNDLSGNILGGINISSGGASLSQSGNLS